MSEKSGIVIPARPPPSIVEALQNFVAAIDGYGDTGVWPDNHTLLELAKAGREALRNSRYGTKPTG